MKASSESGEWASLISTGSLAVFDDAVLPAMGCKVLLALAWNFPKELPRREFPVENEK
jgi:hypothetical protein